MAREVEQIAERVCFERVPPSRAEITLADAVRQGMASDPKELPSWIFYDKRGSDLFDKITALPEYYLTGAERDILRADAASMVQAVGQKVELVELGSGSGVKTRLLIHAALEQQDEVRYVPIDISGPYLREQVRRLAEDFPRLSAYGLAADYRDGLAHLPDPTAARLFLFMGSNIGNLERTDAISLLGAIRKAMRPEDRLLLGTDLVKPTDLLVPAYNDAHGVTADFNKNMLLRLNVELEANFDVTQFRHEAPWIADQERIEMRLISKREQKVRFGALDLSADFADGEWMRTEISQKYTQESLRSLALEAQLCPLQRWTDRQERFAVTLLEAA